ncbi:MAG: UMP kinase [Endomicrobium sp.]|jgi:uridylate kinase|nr:UMP kinase [Endomicrobium sp.]
MRSKRVLLKLSGESFCDGSSSISQKCLLRTVEEIKHAISRGVELSIVVGAGNIWRGVGKFIERVTADKMGMLATVMNALALNEALLKAKIKAIVLCASGVSSFVEDFSVEKAINYIELGYVVIFAGGTGNPYFTTDTTAALRAAEIKTDVLLKATQVDGVYSADPKKDKGAIKYDFLTFKEAINKQLKVMDSQAFSLCEQTNISIIVFDFYKDGNLKKVLCGEKIGTSISKNSNEYKLP